MKNKKRIISKYLTQVFETTDSSAEWFGYYNYDTLNPDHTKMLCNRSQSEKSEITKNDTIELGYYDVPEGVWHKIGESDSWNWQQGAMMQWLHGEGNDSKVIYNCSRNGHLTSLVHDIDTGEDKEIDWPIYGLTPDGKKSISLDLERSFWCRAYHYQSVANPEKDGRVVEGDGIFEIDLENNTRRLLIDIKDVIALEPDPDFDEMKHWVEHIMINPVGTRFCFLHRYSPVNNVLQYKTRICVANIDGSNLQVIPGWNTYMWSHFGWQGPDNFVIYTYKRPSYFKNFDAPLSVKGHVKNENSVKIIFRKLAVFIRKRIPKRFYKSLLAKNCYYQHYMLGDNSKYKLESEWIKPYFDVDGHPSFSSVIAKMPENKLQGNASCDLHPKLSRDNQYVVFDTTSSAKHSMMMFRLNWDLIRGEIG